MGGHHATAVALQTHLAVCLDDIIDHFWVAEKIYPRVGAGQHKLWTTFVVGDTDKSIQQLSALHTGTRTVSIRFSFIFM